MGLSISPVRFLKRLWTVLEGYFRGISLLGTVQDDELLARYLLDRRDFTLSGAKPRVFLPPPDRKTSVFRIRGLSEVWVWSLAAIYVERQRGPALARAELNVRQVTGTGLAVEPDEPPPRHANIAGWPRGKDEQKSLAQELAARSTLRLK